MYSLNKVENLFLVKYSQLIKSFGGDAEGNTHTLHTAVVEASSKEEAMLKVNKYYGTLGTPQPCKNIKYVSYLNVLK